MQNDTPRFPPGWEAAADTLIRLTNTDESALAWIAPTHGANCVAFMVRRDDAWVEVLHHTGREEFVARPSRFGCAVLFPFPGHMMDFRYRWRGATYTIPRRGSTAQSLAHGFAHTHAWHVAERAPDHLIATFSTPDDLMPDEHAAYPFTVRLTETVALAGDTLQIALHAVNEGSDAAPVGVALHPYFAVAALGGERTRVRVALPGRLEHRLTPPVPTGEKYSVASPVILPPPVGETALIARTDLDSPARAMLAGVPGSQMVEFAFLAGVRDVVAFMPPDQPSISIEPHSCAPSAPSRREGDPDGLLPLAPGASLTMAVAISLRPAPTNGQ